MTLPGSGTALAEEEAIQRVEITGHREERETPDFSWLFDRDYGSGPTFYEGGGGGGAGNDNKTEPPAEKDTSTCPKSGNPVILSTGEKYKDEPDFISAGEYGLSLARMYRSKQAKGMLFGRNWLSNLDVPPLQTGGSSGSHKEARRC